MTLASCVKSCAELLKGSSASMHQHVTQKQIGGRYLSIPVSAVSLMLQQTLPEICHIHDDCETKVAVAALGWFLLFIVTVNLMRSFGLAPSGSNSLSIYTSREYNA